MKKWYLLLIPVLFLASCGEDEVGNEKTPEEVSAEMKSIAQDASGDIVTLIESEGVKGATRLIELIGDFDFSARNASREGVKAKIETISHYFINGVAGRLGEETPTTFDDIKGLFEWNPESESFDKSESEFFIVRFPSENSETNNAELKISELEFVTIIEDLGDFTDEYELPSVIVGYLKVDDVIVIDLDFVINWSSVGFPESADIVLTVDPFSLAINFKSLFNESTSSLIASIKLDGEVLTAVDVNVEWLSAEKEEPKIIKGEVQYLNLKIAGRVDAEGLDATFDEENDDDINEFVDLELLLDNEKVGDIVFVDDIAYVEYADGSREVLEEIIQPIFDQIEILVEDFE